MVNNRSRGYEKASSCFNDQAMQGMSADLNMAVGHFTAEDVQELMDFMAQEQGNGIRPNHDGGVETKVATSAAQQQQFHQNDGPGQQFTPIAPVKQHTPDTALHSNTGQVSTSSMDTSAPHLSSGAPQSKLQRQGSSLSATSSTAPTISDSTRSQARIERKRSREKERRNEVNKQMQELTDVLKRIEDEENAIAAARSSRSGNGKTPRPFPSFSPTNRVELIGRTVAHLERLWDLSKQQEAEIKELKQKLTEQAKAAVVTPGPNMTGISTTVAPTPGGASFSNNPSIDATASISASAESSATDQSNFHSMKQQQVRGSANSSCALVLKYSYRIVVCLRVDCAPYISLFRR